MAGCIVAAIMLPLLADELGAPSWLGWAIFSVAVAAGIFTLLVYGELD